MKFGDYIFAVIGGMLGGAAYVGICLLVSIDLDWGTVGIAWAIAWAGGYRTGRVTA